jgi:hypothetical protein
VCPFQEVAPPFPAILDPPRIEIAQEINCREPIVSTICIPAIVQKNVILHRKTFISAKYVPKHKNVHWQEN